MFLQILVLCLLHFVLPPPPPKPDCPLGSIFLPKDGGNDEIYVQAEDLYAVSLYKSVNAFIFILRSSQHPPPTTDSITILIFID